MTSHPQRRPGCAALAILAVLAMAPVGVAAQAPLPASEAQAFLGQWSVPFDTPQGSLAMTIHVEDQEGNVAARIVSDLGTQAVDRAARSGESLVLSYALDFGGQSAPVDLTLTPNGDQMRASMSFAGGQFTLDGTATRAAGG